MSVVFICMFVVVVVAAVVAVVVVVVCCRMFCRLMMFVFVVIVFVCYCLFIVVCCNMYFCILLFRCVCVLLRLVDYKRQQVYTRLPSNTKRSRGVAPAKPTRTQNCNSEPKLYTI